MADLKELAGKIVKKGPTFDHQVSYWRYFAILYLLPGIKLIISLIDSIDSLASYALL